MMTRQSVGVSPRWIPLVLTSAIAWTVPAAIAAAVVGGELQVAGDAGAMPLLRTEVDAEIAGVVARVEVLQVFASEVGRPIDATYVFPLPDRAAVNGFEIEVAGRRVRGQIERREQAREMFERARARGHVAALLDQERPNVFTQSVANIPPGEHVVVRLQYVDVLPLEAGRGTFRFPMVVGPRYTPIGGAPLRHAEREPPVERSGADIAIRVRVDGGVPLAGLRCATHAVDVERTTASSATVRLAGEPTIPNRDFVLEYVLAGAAPTAAILAHRPGEGGDGHFVFLLQPPADVPPEQAAPKHVVFLVDRSSSMKGPNLDTVKRVVSRALDTLGPEDTFDIVVISDDARSAWDRLRENNPDDIADARAFLDRLESDGGTVLLRGLEVAFGRAAPDGRLKLVVLLTDGLVSNEDELMRAVAAHAGQARLLTVTIGAAPNHYLTRRLAQVGRGACLGVSPGPGGEAAIGAFLERFARPYLTDITIDWGRLPVSETTPEVLPDLYAGHTLVVSARYSWGAEETVLVGGRLGGVPWRQEIRVVLPEHEAGQDALPVLWARNWIDELVMRHALAPSDAERGPLEERITDLGLRFGLVTPYTSFVAIDEERVVAPADAAAGDEPDTTPPGKLTEAVTVTARVDLISLDVSAASVSADEFADLPVFGRDYQRAFLLAPGIQDAGGDGNPNVHGARDVDFRVLVDGVATSDPLTGRFTTHVNPDAIEEMEIVDAGASAAYGGTVGGYGRIVTKSGGNRHEGSVRLLVRDAPGETGASPRALEPSATVQGPLISDRLWFLASLKSEHERDPVDMGRGVFRTRSFATSDVLGKLTFQASPRHKLTLQLGSNVWRRRPIGADTLLAAESAAALVSRTKSASLTWTSPFSASLAWDLSAGLSRGEGHEDPVARATRASCGPAGGQCLDLGSGRTSGAHPRDRDQATTSAVLRLDATKFIDRWLLGTHELWFGFEGEREIARRVLLRRPLATLLGPDGLLVEASAAPGATTGSADRRRLALFVSDAYDPTTEVRITLGLRLVSEAASADGFAPFDPAAERSAFDAAVADCVAAGGSVGACAAAASGLLTASTSDDPGAYADCALAPNPPACRLLAAADGGPRLRARDEFTIASRRLLPRVHVAWMPPVSALTKFRAGWARHDGRTALDGLLAEAGPESRATYAAGGASIPGAVSIRATQRSLQPPFSDEWTLGAEREVAEETTLSARWVRRSVHRRLELIDVNHRIVDGVSTALNPFFGSILLARDTGSGRERSLTLSLSRRYIRNFGYDITLVRSHVEASSPEIDPLGEDMIVVPATGSSFDRNELRATGTLFVDIAGGFRFGWVATYDSGRPYSAVRTLLVEDTPSDGVPLVSRRLLETVPSGSRDDRRSPARWRADLGVEREFMAGDVRLTARADLLGALGNRGVVVERVQLLAGGTSVPVSYRPPRRQLQLTLSMNY